MFTLNATLDNLIAMVVVLLALSLVVQAVQSAVKKMFKLKSRQIEDSLAYLFQFVLHNETVAERRPGGWWGSIKEMVAQSPFLRIFTTMPHPAEREGKYQDASVLYKEVVNKFKAIGRTALSTRPIFDSLSKGDLLKVVASIEPDVLDSKFADKVGQAVDEFKKLHGVFIQWKEWSGGPDFDADKYLDEEDRAKLAELQARFKPLVDDFTLLLTVETDLGKVVKAIAADIVRLRAVNLGDAQKVLDDVRANARHAAERARLDKKQDVAAVLDALVTQLDSLAAGFAGFRRAYNNVFANWVRLEQSFDTVMQSFEERYTRSMKTAALVISFLVVVFLNANFFTLYRTLSTSDAKREMILQSRQQVTDALARNAQAAAPDAAARDQQTQETVQSWFKASREEIDRNADIFEGYGFAPITLHDTKAWLKGWMSGNPWTNFKHDAKVLLGWLLMTLLLSVGAPFWQDFLESLFGVKNVLRKRSETQNVEQASGAGQTKQS